MEAELGIAAEIDAENERQMAEIADTEILGRGMINAFAPLLVRVVGNEGGSFNSEILMQSSMLALCKFMCVSASFCEKHLPLVFSALSKAPKEDTTMRANTAVALGDLAFRFPNEVEPYTPHLYACLRDSSTKVRRHTLMVLTHLILNDMVKVKGQVCEIALCLKDEDGRIRDMAGLLFHSLASRSNNPIYNLLPDIISQLSQCDIRPEDFRSILSFLLGFIKKERQMQMLSEKLVLRMGKATSISSKADLAYCICQLKHGEKSIKCLMDNFKLYKDALFDADVKKSFLQLISKTKKSAKPELKTVLEDYENKITAMSELGAEDALVDAKAARAKSKRKKKVVATKRPKRQVVQDESDDEDEAELDDEAELSFEEDKENAPAVGNTRRNSRRLAAAS
jgi:condensin complex subunit 1